MRRKRRMKELRQTQLAYAARAFGLFPEYEHSQKGYAFKVDALLKQVGRAEKVSLGLYRIYSKSKPC